MRFLVAYIVSFMSSLFLTLYVGNDLIQYGYSTYGHVAFLILFSFLSGAFSMLATDKYWEVLEEVEVSHEKS
jgi:hypothetical protein